MLSIKRVKTQKFLLFFAIRLCITWIVVFNDYGCKCSVNFHLETNTENISWLCLLWLYFQMRCRWVFFSNLRNSEQWTPEFKSFLLKRKTNINNNQFLNLDWRIFKFFFFHLCQRSRFFIQFDFKKERNKLFIIHQLYQWIKLLY